MTNLEAQQGLRVRKLESGDERSAFRSGNADLDRFFHRYAGQNQFRHHLGTTYIAVDADGAIAGFATVTASEIAPSTVGRVKKGLPKYPLPVIRLARLAVDERARGKGMGSLLLRTVFLLARKMADDVGCVGIVVDAKPDAVSFYEKLGFLRLEVRSGELGDRPQPVPLFLELAQLPF